MTLYHSKLSGVGGYAIVGVLCGLAAACAPTTASIRSEARTAVSQTANATGPAAPQVESTPLRATAQPAPAEVDSEQSALAKAWQDEVTEAAAHWHARLIYPVCDETVPAGNACGLVNDTYSRESFESFAAAQCQQASEGSSASPCLDQFRAGFVSALRARYHMDPEQYCQEGGCHSFFDVELRVLRAYNKAIVDGERQAVDSINSKYKAMSMVVNMRSEASLLPRSKDGSVAHAAVGGTGLEPATSGL